MQNPEELLAQLKDIDLPAESAFAIAPGWIALFVLLLLLFWAAWRFWQARKRRLAHWRVPARAELEAISQQIQTENRHQVLADCSKLARRVVLAREPRTEVAALTGAQWLHKLDQLAGGNFFTEGNGQVIASGPYQSQPVTDPGLLRDITNHLSLVIDAPEVESPAVTKPGKPVQ